jgi:hypothetical protein
VCRSCPLPCSRRSAVFLALQIALPLQCGKDSTDFDVFFDVTLITHSSLAFTGLVPSLGLLTKKESIPSQFHLKEKLSSRLVGLEPTIV